MLIDPYAENAFSETKCQEWFCPYKDCNFDQNDKILKIGQ